VSQIEEVRNCNGKRVCDISEDRRVVIIAQKGCVTRITANQALDLLKKESRTHQLLTTEADLPPEQLQNLPDDEPDVGRLSPETLTALIAKLPPGYRAVLNLHIFEGHSHNEIAALLGIKPDSSASQFLRAKRMLAKMINESINHND
jgi:RNA polymerase sigma-70 factor (ECF subfamily)